MTAVDGLDAFDEILWYPTWASPNWASPRRNMARLSEVAEWDRGKDTPKRGRLQ
jgi:hypothetical protein